MDVYKFGGASVKDAQGVTNVVNIIKMVPNKDLVVVVSAMGKMTNAFEKLLKEYRSGSEKRVVELNTIRTFHDKVAKELKIPNTRLQEGIQKIFTELEMALSQPPTDNYDYDYDRIVSFGELLSTKIVSEYLQAAGLENTWTDARTIIRTNDKYREAKVEWTKTRELVVEKWREVKAGFGANRSMMITQGFIGHTAERNTTTLGREGSDFSAAIFAYSLGAESVSIWKDVPGVLNADPKTYSDAVLLKRISYREAIELSYYGASVIHPKTIKPLQNEKIPLYVRSFSNFEEQGTIIESATFSDSLIPSFIFKNNQVLISFTPRDFSFIVEENLSELFGIFAAQGVKINLMQNSALNFSVCVDFNRESLDIILNECQEKYEVLYNEKCQLVTIRHYDQETISRLLIGKSVLVEQRSRSTARMVLVDGN
ncbi:MAG TPA: aspartate kinase [Cryomorphaceae bacterium]|nr:aspartate kinase [Cryomorphaceae bacterium]